MLRWRRQANEFARHVWIARWKSRRCPGMPFCVTSLQASGMTLSWFQRYRWKANIPLDGSTSRDFSSSILLGSYGGLKLEVVEVFSRKVVFLEKMPPYGKIFNKKPSYRWGTARRGRASWNLVKFCTNVDDLYLKSSETRLLPIRL